MKKGLIALLILAATTTVLIGCGKNRNNNIENNKPSVSDEKTNDENNNEDSNDKVDSTEGEGVSAEDDNASTDNTYSEAEMEEIEAVTTEQIEEYARELGQKYYDYEVDLDVAKKVDGINLYYFAIHSGPPNNTVKEYMLGADGVLYNYESALNGVLEIEE